MRTYGRAWIGGKLTWVKVETALDGSNDAVILTTLIQNFRLNLNESPFYGNFGIPAKQAIISQTHPDLYVSLTQQRFAPFFASLIISKQPGNTPAYKVDVVTNQGVKLSQVIPG